ncbi:hypothetical protein BVRB_7g172540 [Beta vulgaris subsp. vulgaris]|uniref:josephin-like protein n=1 Tax=Beta vulgaris subsp. vulgaris TaxID=3555 RepID=UPI00053F64EE|nr:josephin-like protein [Beta vulgaris subsp. vulgaris]KMT05100.1 hypothetical protein BVRB_7g172540 [Beta vulgaris subsp. vulgaris]
MEEEMNAEVYHERQKLQFCLLHALNNLFQERDAFSKADLDGIAEDLILNNPNPVKWTPISAVLNPHYNMFTGNYDANVLMAALERRGKRLTWHDKRNQAATINLDGLMGIVLNVTVRRFAGLLKNRHWVTLRKINGVWYNLDSDLRAPSAFTNVDGVRVFLDSVIRAGDQILLVTNDNLDAL